jgi:CDGSH iron-sulfur domain-containing protein 3
MSQANQGFRIRVRDNGPYHIPGTVSVVDVNGNVIRTEADLALCRCGHSGDKPFCDGSHRHAGFESSVRADDGSSNPAGG